MVTRRSNYIALWFWFGSNVFIGKIVLKKCTRIFSTQIPLCIKYTAHVQTHNFAKIGHKSGNNL